MAGAVDPLGQAEMHGTCPGCGSQGGTFQVLAGADGVRYACAACSGGGEGGSARDGGSGGGQG